VKGVSADLAARSTTIYPQVPLPLLLFIDFKTAIENVIQAEWQNQWNRVKMQTKLGPIKPLLMAL